MLRKRSASIALTFAAGVGAMSGAVSPMTALAADDLPPCSSNDVSTWTGCVGSYAISDVGTYVGEFQNGRPNGKGALTYRAYGEYIGTFRDGRPEGRGTYSYADGRRYVGDWHNGEFDGYGTRTYPDGRKEVGEWRAGALIQEAEESSRDQIPIAILVGGIFVALGLALRIVFGNSVVHPESSSADKAVMDEQRKFDEIRKMLVEAVDNFDISDDALIKLREDGRRTSKRLNDLKRRTGVAWLLGALKLS
jgi:hypothetical protein